MEYGRGRTSKEIEFMIGKRCDVCGKDTGNRWFARCPVHGHWGTEGDRRLAISEGKKL